MNHIGRWVLLTGLVALGSLGCTTDDDGTDNDGGGGGGGTEDLTTDAGDVSSTTGVDEAEGSDGGRTLKVFVFAENEDEQRYYEELVNDFTGSTGGLVDLEVRLP